MAATTITLPYNITNGSTNDASQVMADLNSIVTATNANFTDAASFSQATAYPVGTLGKKLQQYISVKDAPYNAKGDWNGTTGTDDTAAIQLALTAIQTAGSGALYLPTGSYLVTPGSLAIASGALTIFGDGINKTRIVSNAGTGVQLTITQLDFNNATNVRDLSFITYSTELHTALVVNGNATDSQINRTQSRFEMRNVEARGNAQSSYGHTKGFILSNLHQMSLYNCTATGRQSAATRAGLTNMLVGFDITGSSGGIPSDFTINGCHANLCVYGFKMTLGMEGPNFTQCYAVACDYGYYSDQSAAGTRPWTSFLGCHAAVFVGGITMINVPQVIAADNLIYKRIEANSLTTAISLTTCDLSIAHDNVIYNSATDPVANGDYIGVKIGGTTTGASVHHNRYDRVQVGTWVADTASSNKIESNGVTTLFGTGTPVEYYVTSTGTGNKRINNPAYETSVNYAGAGVVLSVVSANVVSLSLDSCEVGDEYVVTGTMYSVKDTTAGVFKGFIAQSAGTAVVTFENSNTSARGSTYLPASTEGYVTFSSRMKVTTAGTLQLTLSAAVTAGGCTIATNNAQFSVARK